MTKIKKSGIILALITGFLFFGLVAAAETIVRSFDAQGSLQPGGVVALSQASDTTVELAPSDDPSRIYGVVIDPSAAPLTVQKQNQQVFVATSGNYLVLVSTQNGAIGSGDYLSMSNADGIAAKAETNEQFIVGRALENFDGKGTTIVYANDGSALGRIIAQVLPGKNPLLKDAASIPQPLRRVGESIAGKPLSALRIYAAVAIFVIAGVIAAIMLWAGIRNAMVAIGRNPLSRHSIIRGLFQVIIAATSVLIIGLLGVYLLLKI
ncbi:MAG TPA: hypothetical protein VI336_04245 [Candidatus Saccharimonadales bacterium]|nr:hypothetical protein [Candidatus Saccharimonadales bacterium]